MSVIVWPDDVIPYDGRRAVKYGGPVVIDESTLSSWGKALAIVAAFGVVGAFIDFYIGKPGQRRVRDWLETWWLRLSYVHWGNFGREEALFAVQVIDRVFGRRLFSVRRVIAVGVVVSWSLCMILGLFMLKEAYVVWTDFIGLRALLNFILIVCSVAASFSITCFVARQISSIIAKAPYLNFLGFAFLLVLQYGMLGWWSPTIVAVHGVFAQVFGLTGTYRMIYEKFRSFGTYPPLYLDISLRNFTHFTSPVAQIHDIFSLSDEMSSVSFSSKFAQLDTSVIFMEHLAALSNLIPNLVRLAITLIFVSSFLLHPFQRPIMTLWARVIESDKPVFTLVFGGAAALAKAIQEIVKIFWR
jgi:hypothetical protein